MRRHDTCAFCTALKSLAAVDDLVVSVEEYGAGDFVFEVEAGDLVDGDGDEFVAHGDEEVSAVVVEGSCEGGELGGGGGGEGVEFVEGVLEVVAVDGFEEVIDGVDFEGLEGVLVVGGGEDDGAVGMYVVEDAEGESVGEVYVEEYEVGGGLMLEVFYAFLDALECGEDVGVGEEFGDETLEVLCGYVFVFDDEDVFHFLNSDF